jgi:hypothetical protein
MPAKVQNVGERAYKYWLSAKPVRADEKAGLAVVNACLGRPAIDNRPLSAPERKSYAVLRCKT